MLKCGKLTVNNINNLTCNDSMIQQTSSSNIDKPVLTTSAFVPKTTVFSENRWKIFLFKTILNSSRWTILSISVHMLL